MKTLRTLVCLLAILMTAQVGFSQTVLIGGNQYAFRWTGDPDIGLYFSSTNSRYEFRDLSGAAEYWINPIARQTYVRGTMSIGALPTATSCALDVRTTNRLAAVSGRGQLAPTNGYLGAQGATNFDGIATLDISGQEVGVLGISTGGSASDNTGVYGHSNGSGVYGEHSTSGNSATLGTSVYSIDADGTARINGGSDVSPASGGYLVVGNEAGLNITTDNNEIMARSNGATSTLFLNNNGGNVSSGGTGTAHTLNGTSTRINISGSNSATAPGPFQIANGSSILASDGNEMQAYSGTTPTTYYVNFYGGSVDIANSFGGTARNVTIFNDLIHADGPDDHVGIRTSAPCYDLHVKHTQFTDGGFAIENEFNNALWQMYVSQSTSELRLMFDGTGASCGGALTRGNFSSTTGAYSAISDARLKDNIQDLNSGEMLSVLKSLSPKSYTFNHDEEQGTYFGFLAQELLTQVPQAVSHLEDGEDLYLVNYDELIPVLVASVQEQQEMIESLDPQSVDELKAEIQDKDAEIDALNDRLDRVETMLARLDKDMSACCTSSSSDIAPSASERGSLSQNIPNPFNGTTTINYYLPKDASFASLKVTDINGSLVKEFNLQGEGFGQISFASETLAGGNYFYSLFIDGEVIDTKQMNLAK